MLDIDLSPNTGSNGGEGGEQDAWGKPLLFSYTDVYSKKGRIKIRAADSGWSQAIGLDSAGTAGVVEVEQEVCMRVYSICLT